MEPNIHIIESKSKIIEALNIINQIEAEPLILFIVNEKRQMVGTLTDGDIRRALINGVNINSNVLEAANKNFYYLSSNTSDHVKEIYELRNKKVYLIPLLDDERHIVEIINLEKTRTLLPIDAVLMAGGKGERLRPLTEKIPKPLLKVGDKAIIDYNIEQLISYGVKNISVTVNYLKEQIEEHFSKPILATQIKCIREPQFLGTIGSLKFVPQFHNDVILIMNSDLFTNINYEDFYLHFKEYNADMSVACVPYSMPIPYGIFDLDGRIIKGIQEKPTYHFYANAGIYLIKKSLLTKIPENKFFNATDLIKTLIKDKMKVIRFPLTGYWIDIGKHEEYSKAQELVKHLN